MVMAGFCVPCLLGKAMIQFLVLSGVLALNGPTWPQDTGLGQAVIELPKAVPVFIAGAQANESVEKCRELYQAVARYPIESSYKAAIGYFRSQGFTALPPIQGDEGLTVQVWLHEDVLDFKFRLEAQAALRMLAQASDSDADSPVLEFNDLGPSLQGKVMAVANALKSATGGGDDLALAGNAPVHFSVQANGFVEYQGDVRPISTSSPAAPTERDKSRLVSASSPSLPQALTESKSLEVNGLLYRPATAGPATSEWIDLIALANQSLREHSLRILSASQELALAVMSRLGAQRMNGIDRAGFPTAEAPGWLQSEAFSIAQKTWGASPATAREVSSQSRMQGMSFSPALKVRVSHGGRTFVALIPLT